MRTDAAARAAVLLLSAGCEIANVDVGGETADAARPEPVTGACGATLTTLARVPHVRARPMSLDGANLYVVATGANGDAAHDSVWRVPKTGGEPELVAGGQERIGGLSVWPSSREATAGAALYWTAGGAVWKLASSTEGPVALVQGRDAPGAIVAVGQRVYWSERGAIVWTPAAGGGAVTTLQEIDPSRPPQRLTAHDGGLVWTTFDPDLANEASAEVVSAPLPLPFAPTSRVAGPDLGGGAGAIALGSIFYDPWLFYAGPTGITGIRATTLGSSPRVDIATAGFVRALAADDHAVYFVDPAGGALMAAATAPDAHGEPRTLAPGVDPDGALRVDAACVYSVDARAESVTMVHE